MATPSTIHREATAAMENHDLKRVRSLMHAEYTYTGPDGKEVSGPDASIALFETYLAAFPDMRWEIKAVHTQGEVAVAECVFRGTHTGELMGMAPTGRRVELNICNVIEIREDKVYREREYFDMMTMMVQLGLATPPGGAASA